MPGLPRRCALPQSCGCRHRRAARGARNMAGHLPNPRPVRRRSEKFSCRAGHAASGRNRWSIRTAFSPTPLPAPVRPVAVGFARCLIGGRFVTPPEDRLATARRSCRCFAAGRSRRRNTLPSTADLDMRSCAAMAVAVSPSVQSLFRSAIRSRVHIPRMTLSRHRGSLDIARLSLK